MAARDDKPRGESGSSVRFYGLSDDVIEVNLHEPDARPDAVHESLIQDVWRHQRFDTRELKTVSGQSVQIIEPGLLNTDQGPDFRDARIRIDGTLLTGSVEIHHTSSGWIDHGHHRDPRYNSVILHVILKEDMFTGTLVRNDNTQLDELVLFPRLESSLRNMLHHYNTRKPDSFICSNSWPSVPPSIKLALIRRLGRDRFLAKRDRAGRAFIKSPDMVQLLYEDVFAALGYSKNAEPMRDLARRVPLRTARELQDQLDREALYFGVSGLLPSTQDLLDADRATADFVQDLTDRFDRLKIVYDVQPMPRTSWRFFRLRPVNFPTMRIAQASALLNRGSLFHGDAMTTIVETIRSADGLDDLRALLTCRPHPFWETHVRLEKSTYPHNPGIGRERCDAILVNAILPIALLFSDQMDDLGMEDRILSFFHKMPAHQDEIVSLYAYDGFKPRGALESQGLHELKRNWCLKARCLECDIGRYLLNTESVLT